MTDTTNAHDQNVSDESSLSAIFGKRKKVECSRQQDPLSNRYFACPKHKKRMCLSQFDLVELDGKRDPYIKLMGLGQFSVSFLVVYTHSHFPMKRNPRQGGVGLSFVKY